MSPTWLSALNVPASMARSAVGTRGSLPTGAYLPVIRPWSMVTAMYELDEICAGQPPYDPARAECRSGMVTAMPIRTNQRRPDPRNGPIPSSWYTAMYMPWSGRHWTYLSVIRPWPMVTAMYELDEICARQPPNDPPQAESPSGWSRRRPSGRISLAPTLETGLFRQVRTPPCTCPWSGRHRASAERHAARALSGERATGPRRLKPPERYEAAGEGAGASVGGAGVGGGVGVARGGCGGIVAEGAG